MKLGPTVGRWLSHIDHWPGWSRLTPPLARALAQRGAQTLLEFFARGASGQVLGRHHQGDMTGLWAIEPHLGFGQHAIKFEELLLVTPTQVSWLRDVKS